MSKLILTVGVSSSGKTTWAEDYCNRNPNTVNLNRDHVRFTVLDPNGNWDTYHGTEFDELRVNAIIDYDFEKAVREGKDIVISDTNLSMYTRDKWVNAAKLFNLDLEYYVFNTTFEELFYRNSKRLMKVKDHVITGQYKRFTQFLEELPTPGATYVVI